MKKLIVIILLPFSVFCQYSKNDSNLVFTTFTREFNKEIINDYLNSAEPQKVKAALLSVSHSNDTSFVNDIIKLNYDKYSKEICFALGQLGSCILSEDFLLTKLNNDLISSPLLESLGKCGSNSSFDAIINKYNAGNDSLNGISLSLFYFNSRGLLNKEQAIPVLLNELSNPDFDKRRQADAAFVLYRLNSSNELREYLLKEIKSELASSLKSDDSINKLFNMLGCLRQIKFFPDDDELFQTLLNNSNYIIRVEASRTLCYSQFNNENDLDNYLNFFDDPNPNITRTAAIALQELKLTDELKNYLKNWIQDKIKTSELSANTRGELFNSYVGIFKPGFEDIANNFSESVSSEFIYQAVSAFNDSSIALDYLLERFNSETNKNKLIILWSSLEFQDKFRNNETLLNVIIKSINADFPPLVSIAADGIDSLNIVQNKDTLTTLIYSNIKNHLNNPDYIESIFSLVNLAEKIDSSFYTEILTRLKKSELFSVQAFIAGKTGDKNTASKDASIFTELWGNAFKYTSAEIETTVGIFTIKFLPEYAPVSVGSFCSLAAKGFFNNNIFHRVVPAFVVQGGDPSQTGWGGPGYEIISETSTLEYVKGIVGMASAGKDTEGSQWFVTTGYYPHLNGKYTIFAEISGGMETVNNTDQDDTIKSIHLIP